MRTPPPSRSLQAVPSAMAESNEINEMAEVIQSPRLRALIRYWHEKRGRRPMPSRSDIDPVEIPRLLPIALIADARANPTRIRLIGTETTLFCGREMRGKSVDAFDFGRFTPAWTETFALVARSGIPAAASGSYSDDMRSYAAEMVLLPLSDKDEGVALIFGGLHIRTILPGSEPTKRPVIYVLPFAAASTAATDRRGACQ